ncbi:hypothetical protein ACUUL3_05480 [Thiovibrio sp. JS02]
MSTLPFSSFFPSLEIANALAKEEFSRWIFLPGMLFLSPEKWWRPGRRAVPHEGLDIAGFETRDGQRRPLSPGCLIPAVYAGTVVTIIPDFLANTVVVGHEATNREGWRLHSLYSHVSPLVQTGAILQMGDVLARIAALGTPSPAGPPPHLHLSLAWLAPDFPLPKLDWAVLASGRGVDFLDPLCLLAWSLSRNPAATPGKEKGHTANAAWPRRTTTR